MLPKLPKGFKLKWKMPPKPTGSYKSFFKRGSWGLHFRTPWHAEDDKLGDLLMFVDEIDQNSPYSNVPPDFDPAKPFKIYFRPEGMKGPTLTFKARFATQEEAKNWCEDLLVMKTAYVEEWIAHYTDQHNREEQECWECNECGSQEYTMSVSESDVNKLRCGDCGGQEWHRAKGK
jgi:hypothetical protein